MGSCKTFAIVEIPFNIFTAVCPWNALALAAGLIPELFVTISETTFFTFAQLAFATFKVPYCSIICIAFSLKRLCSAVYNVSNAVLTFASAS